MSRHAPNALEAVPALPTLEDIRGALDRLARASEPPGCVYVMHPETWRAVCAMLQITPVCDIPGIELNRLVPERDRRGTRVVYRIAL